MNWDVKSSVPTYVEFVSKSLITMEIKVES